MKVFITKPIHPKIRLQHHNFIFSKKKKIKNFVFKFTTICQKRTELKEVIPGSTIQS